MLLVYDLEMGMQELIRSDVTSHFYGFHPRSVIYPSGCLFFYIRTVSVWCNKKRASAMPALSGAISFQLFLRPPLARQLLHLPGTRGAEATI